MTFDFAMLLLFASTAFAADTDSIVPIPLNCFDCKNIKDPRLCNTVTTCNPDQPCIDVTGFRIENSNLFSNGVVVGKRSTGLKSCSVCCGDSLCNNVQCFALTKNLRELWKGGHLDLASLSYKQ